MGAYKIYGGAERNYFETNKTMAQIIDLQQKSSNCQV